MSLHSEPWSGPRLLGWRSLSFILLVFSLLACGEGKNENDRGTAEHKEGSGKNELDSLRSRVKELNERIREDPQNADLFYERAETLEKQGKVEDAIGDIERALRIDSGRTDFHELAGELFFQKGDVEKAKDHYRQAIALDGDNTDALIGMAELYMATRQNQKAIDYANEALKVDQHLPRPYTIKGLIHQRTGDTAKAISSFQTTVELDPENHSAFLQLGFLMAAKDRELALEYYNTASRLEPDDPRPLYNKGLYLQDHGRPDEAIETYKELIQVDTGYVEAYYNIGYIHLVHKDSARKAIDWFDKVLNLTPDYHQAIYNRGLCYEKLGKRDSAIQAYRRALEIKKDYRAAAKGLQRLEAPYRPDNE